MQKPPTRARTCAIPVKLLSNCIQTAFKLLSIAFPNSAALFFGLSLYFSHFSFSLIEKLKRKAAFCQRLFLNFFNVWSYKTKGDAHQKPTLNRGIVKCK